MRILLTGGGGVLGRAAIPRLRAGGHEVRAPGRAECDLLDPAAVREALRGARAVMHLATRIPPPERMGDPAAWAANDRLRRDATRVLVDAALAAGVEALVLPTVALVYPAVAPADGVTPADAGAPADEDTPLGAVAAPLRSALDAEREVARFASAGGSGVVLRLGLLDGPGTARERPDPRFDATLHVDDAGRALAAALRAPSGIYNVCRDGERVRNARFRAACGWRPER